MAHYALHASLDMLAMTPVYAGGELVDADPGNWLGGLAVPSKFLDCRLVFCDGHVALHAYCGRGEGHHVTGAGIGVAAAARKA